MESLPVVDPSRLHAATLVRSDRITPPDSREEVRHLVFRRDDPSIECRAGQCIQVIAPGQFGNKFHPRLYLVAEPDGDVGGATEFAICVRRHLYVDDFNGEEYRGVASNYLCDLRPGAEIHFAGPSGYPFVIPDNRRAGIVMIGMGTGIAPFRALIRGIYNGGGWEGRVRLYYGARSGLEMLYMNEENDDLAQYFDQPTFKAFQAVSPRPHFDVPVELDRAIAANAAEVWEMLREPETRVFIAGARDMLAMVDRALAGVAGSPEAWQRAKEALVDTGRWSETLY